MRKLLLAIFIFSSCFCYAQINLVPNPSFEDTVSCPTTANQIDKAFGWHASRESPDYFNECDFVTGTTSVPSNFNGYQYANSGVAYAGYVSFTNTSFNIREYATCQLLMPLVIGKRYNVSFYVSWAAGYVSKRIATNKLGLLFSTVNYTLTSPPPVNNYCQFYSDSIITDSLNWVNIHGSFVADSNYSYLSIGNFFDDLNTDTLILNTPSSTLAYYFIDDISVVEDTITSFNNWIAIQKFKVYPNPFDDVLNIYSKSQDFIEVNLFHLDKLIKSFEFVNKNSVAISLNNLTPGFYLLRITNKQKNQFNYKIIKK